jgi:F-type H+-transporting ATPase subunit a
MPEHEIWLTALLNKFLAGPANALLDAVKVEHEAAHPWSNWMSMELLVVLIIMILFAVLRSSLSMDKPGGLQHIFETLYTFLHEQTTESVDHHGERYLSFFGTLFIFILFMNLIGVVPGFESPTMFPSVPAGCAIAVFLYYNWAGIREVGLGKYLKHFIGPMPAIAFLMIPIEIISHLARPLSLTIRLFANMFAGEKVTLAFMALVPIAIPAVFMGLHVFVSFLQAYIFALMAMIYVGTSVAHEH